MPEPRPRRFPSRAAAALAFALAATVTTAPGIATARAATPVDLELVLAVDASASVSYDEFNLQMTGLARAFRDKAVIGAIESAAPRGVAVSLIQWSGAGAQALAVGWTLVRDGASARAFAARIDAAPRMVSAGGTAIGAAIARAAAAFDGNGYQGVRRAIDVSGDGVSNRGPPPEIARARALAAGITVNGLAILNDEPGLDGYYARAVIGGAGSFVIAADDYADFARAIRLKLILEATGAPMAEAPAPRLRREARNQPPAG